MAISRSKLVRYLYVGVTTVVILLIMGQWGENGRYASMETSDGTIVLDTRTGTRYVYYNYYDKPYWEKLEFMKPPHHETIKPRRAKRHAVATTEE